MVHQRNLIYISLIICSLLYIVKSKDENDINFASKQSGYEKADDAWDEDEDDKSDEDIEEDAKDEDVKEQVKRDTGGNFYSFTVLDSEGKGVDLGQYKGKVRTKLSTLTESNP